MEIRKGTRQDIDEVAALYDELTEYLEGHTNYPGWKKGIYPTREDAVSGTAEENLFVVIEEIDDNVITSYCPETGPAVAFELMRMLLGEEKTKTVRNAMGY